MRYSVEATINADDGTIIVPGVYGVENVCLIVDETIAKCISSSMQKQNLVNNETYPSKDTNNNTTTFKISPDFYNTFSSLVQSTDMITFQVEDFKKTDDILDLLNTFAYGCNIEINNDGEETYTMKLDQSGRVNGDTLVLNITKRDDE